MSQDTRTETHSTQPAQRPESPDPASLAFSLHQRLEGGTLVPLGDLLDSSTVIQPQGVARPKKGGAGAYLVSTSDLFILRDDPGHAARLPRLSAQHFGSTFGQNSVLVVVQDGIQAVVAASRIPTLSEYVPVGDGFLGLNPARGISAQYLERVLQTDAATIQVRHHLRAAEAASAARAASGRPVADEADEDEDQDALDPPELDALWNVLVPNPASPLGRQILAGTLWASTEELLQQPAVNGTSLTLVTPITPRDAARNALALVAPRFRSLLGSSAGVGMYFALEPASGSHRRLVARSVESFDVREADESSTPRAIRGGWDLGRGSDSLTKDEPLVINDASNLSSFDLLVDELPINTLSDDDGVCSIADDRRRLHEEADEYAVDVDDGYLPDGFGTTTCDAMDVFAAWAAAGWQLSDEQRHWVEGLMGVAADRFADGWPIRLNRYWPGSNADSLPDDLRHAMQANLYSGARRHLESQLNEINGLARPLSDNEMSFLGDLEDLDFHFFPGGSPSIPTSILTAMADQWLEWLAPALHRAIAPFLLLAVREPGGNVSGALGVPLYTAVDAVQIVLQLPRIAEALQQEIGRQMGQRARIQQEIANEVVGRVAHTFRNRLGNLDGDLKRLRQHVDARGWSGEWVVEQELASELAEQFGRPVEAFTVGGYFGRLDDHIGQMRHVVGRFREYFRGSQGPPVDIDLNQEIQQAVQGWAAQRPDVPVVCDLDPRAPTVRMSLDAFHEVLDNILQNSSRYVRPAATPPEGHRLDVMSRATHDRVIVEIRNTGESTLPPNPTGLWATTNAGEGTGLGLATVARNVREAGGSFKIVANEPGPGVTNHIELPNVRWDGVMPDSGGDQEV